ncbi:hypothetical protein B9Z19DRAFT_1138933 [Tuber borchii]|uniref:Uncharacterized protein n=1 Tax=Tuber borchii TaxID=42251 RepID=A0A2T6Z9R8_TUBBO|nr:hypothetical protein B9Z19DRAFT_1138933 [Tuber borchii]
MAGMMCAAPPVAVFVAPSVAVSVASSVASSGSSVLGFSEGKLRVMSRRRSPPRGTIVREVDDDDDLVMGFVEPIGGPVDAAALQSAIYRQNILCRDRSTEQRVIEVERMVARDGLDPPPPRPIGILALGRDLEFVKWGARRLPVVETNTLEVTPHLCPVAGGGVNGVRCSLRGLRGPKNSGPPVKFPALPCPTAWGGAFLFSLPAPAPVQVPTPFQAPNGPP